MSASCVSFKINRALKEKTFLFFPVPHFSLKIHVVRRGLECYSSAISLRGVESSICCHSCLISVPCNTSGVILRPSCPTSNHLSLILCQPIRRCCIAWRSSMRRCRAGTATPRLQEALMSCPRTPRNMSALLRSMWECLV